MFESLPCDPNLLKQVLTPLLEDFEYWFGRSRHLLETERLAFMSTAAQAQMLDRVIEAQQSVSIAQSLLTITQGQAGVEMAVLMGWHQLVTECWAMSRQHRSAEM
jgi:Protein of unknown function (DUF2605)